MKGVKGSLACVELLCIVCGSVGLCVCMTKVCRRRRRRRLVFCVGDSWVVIRFALAFANIFVFALVARVVEVRAS